MANDIYVPGEELQAAHDQIGRVLELIRSKGEPADLGGALGHTADVLDAAETFERRWSDGRYQVRTEGEELQKKILEVLDAFAHTDDDLTKDM